MVNCYASDDELVFLIRQNCAEARRALEARMRSKQHRTIRRLLRENRCCGLEFDDLKIVATMSLYNAIDAYDCRKAVFDAYYHFLLERDLVNEMKKYNTFNHTLLNTAFSLDEPFDDGGSLYDVIGVNDEHIGALNPQDILSFAEDAASGLTPKQKAMIGYRLLGYSYSEIGRILKMNYRIVSRTLHKLGLIEKINPHD
ncbi:MAG TPA: hypothetical protein PK340_01560 [Bacilli bacterium]|nr:hypothetical protein [Bacilli bacterium]